jgi:SAM-dependent methyltransferase
MPDDTAQIDQAKARAVAQFGATADKYVASRSHQQGGDLERMVELAEPRPTDRLLDIATGGGNVARTFTPLVGSVVASDLTPTMLAAAEADLRAKGLTNISFAEADAEALPFPDASFEIVTCRIAPHHFPQPHRFLAESARVLVPGGRFLLVDSTVPPGADGEFWNDFERRRDPSHVLSLTTADWRALIAEAGLDLRVVEPYPKRHDFADWAGRASESTALHDNLTKVLLAAPASVKGRFQIERERQRIVAFTDVKTLFFAVKVG